MSNITKKICQLFNSQFGSELKIVWNNSLVNQEERWQAPFVYSRTRKQVTFPIFDPQQKLKAIAVASPVDNDDAIYFQSMADFIQLTVAEFMALEERAETVSRTEGAMGLAHSGGNNVIRWPKKNKSNKPTNTEPQMSENAECPLDPIWIYGEKELWSIHISHACHEWTRNCAFINAGEVPDIVWKDSGYWMGLRQMSILIPNAEQLTTDQWETLKTNLHKLREKKEKPLIMLVSRQRPQDLAPSLAPLFKTYKHIDSANAKSQAHFLMFHHRTIPPWAYECTETDKLYFLPFSRQSDLLH